MLEQAAVSGFKPGSAINTETTACLPRRI